MYLTQLYPIYKIKMSSQEEDLPYIVSKMHIYLWGYWRSLCVYLTLLRWQESPVFQLASFFPEVSKLRLHHNCIGRRKLWIWSFLSEKPKVRKDSMKVLQCWILQEAIIFIQLQLLILLLCIHQSWWLIIFAIQHISQVPMKQRNSIQKTLLLLLMVTILSNPIRRKEFFQWF